MNVNLKGGFFARALNRRLVYLVLAALAAAACVLFSGRERRTFVFFHDKDGLPRVEERMLRRTASREGDIVLYVEEACLGPASPETTPLFERGLRPDSVLLRGGTVYVALPEKAAVPAIAGRSVLKSLETLRSGILRNFPYVRGVRFFINGREAYPGELRGG
ncbi:MAG: hypothetical protein LBR16_02400 [Treponema sp.]|jgi:hypothetical protein|nr:hypothetical protein [Treponema sp.]